MNSSSDPRPKPHPTRLWNIARPASRSHCPSRPRPGMPAASPRPWKQITPDPEALLAARLEAERRAISAQARQEAEREIQRARAEIARAIEQFAQPARRIFPPRRGGSRRPRAGHRPPPASIAKPRSIHACSPVWSTTNSSNSTPRPACASSSPRIPRLLERSRPRHVASRRGRPRQGARRRATSASKPLSASTTVSFERELKEIERGFFDLLSHRRRPRRPHTARVQ